MNLVVALPTRGVWSFSRLNFAGRVDFGGQDTLVFYLLNEAVPETPLIATPEKICR
jgi:hypothetical protein